MMSLVRCTCCNSVDNLIAAADCEDISRVALDDKTQLMRIDEHAVYSSKV